MKRSDFKRLASDYHKARVLVESLGNLESAIRWIKRRWNEGIVPGNTCEVTIHVSGDPYHRCMSVKIPIGIVGQEFLRALEECRKISATGLAAWAPSWRGAEEKTCDHGREA